MYFCTNNCACTSYISYAIIPRVDLNIRSFPDSLNTLLELRSSLAGVSKKQFIVDILEAAVVDGEQVTCPLCGMDGPLVKLGTMARCTHCGSGFVPPEGA